MQEYLQNIGKGIENQYEKLKGFYNKLGDNAIQGWKSFSENPGKHTKEAIIEFGKDYWDLLASFITGYLGLKMSTKTGTYSPLYTDPTWLATQAAWFASMLSPHILKPEKTVIGNHSRVLRNIFGGIIPALHSYYHPPLDWIIDSLSGFAGLLYEGDRRMERKIASKISEQAQKPENLEKTINQTS